MNLTDLGKRAKAAAALLGRAPTEVKNQALLAVADALEAYADVILSANALDLDPLTTAILLRGDLRIAAECAASECMGRGVRVMDSCRRAARLLAIALFVLAIAIIVSR